MKPKKLILLAVVGLALGAWAWWSWQQEQRRAVPEAIGKPAFPNLDVNQVRKILVVSSGSTVSVARVSGAWVVPDRFNYPANFSKVAQCLRELGEAKVWQVMNVAETQLDELNLLLPGHASDDKRESEGTLVTLLGAQDSVLTSFVVGKPFARKPDRAPGGTGMMLSSGQDGQYVRLSDGRVIILPTFLGRLLEGAQHWLADDFLNITAGQLAELTVTGPERAEVVVRRDPEAARLVLQGVADDEETDAAKFNQLTGMLGYLSFHDVANPALTPSQTGLDAPVVVTAVTTQGVAYALSIGGPVATNNPDRYVSVKVSLRPRSAPVPASVRTNAAPDQVAAANEAAEAKKLADTVAELDQRLSPWIYIVKSYRVEPALATRESLVTKKAPPASEPPAAEPAPAGKAVSEPAEPAAAEKPADE